MYPNKNYQQDPYISDQTSKDSKYVEGADRHNPPNLSQVRPFGEPFNPAPYIPASQGYDPRYSNYGNSYQAPPSYYPYPSYPPQYHPDAYRGQNGEHQIPPGPYYPPPHAMAPVSGYNNDLVNSFALLGKLMQLVDKESSNKSPEREHRKKRIHKEGREREREKDREKERERERDREKEVKIGSVVFRPDRGDWKCSVKSCSNWNYSKRERCNICGKPKNDDGRNSHQQRRFPEGRGDNYTRKYWFCPKCDFNNFENKEKCYKCGEKKPEPKGSPKS
jgi:hypothetical protein